MSDWTLPVLTTQYADVLQTYLKGRDVDAITLTETPTNPPTGAIRWNRSTLKFETWDGAVWQPMILSLAGGGTGATTAPGVRTALGLGDMALQNANAVAITGGSITSLTTLTTSGSVDFAGGIQAGSGNINIVDGTGKIPELSASYIAAQLIKGQWTLDGSAPSLKFVNATSNWLEWSTSGVGAPSLTTRSVGTKLVLYPALTSILTDFALGIDTATLWFSIPSASEKFKFYMGVNAFMEGRGDASGTLPTLELSPGVASLGGRFLIGKNASSGANAFLQAGEPGVSGSVVISGNNYVASNTAASGRINTSTAASYIRYWSSSPMIEFVSISSGGSSASMGYFDRSGSHGGARLVVGDNIAFTVDLNTYIQSSASSVIDFLLGSTSRGVTFDGGGGNVAVSLSPGAWGAGAVPGNSLSVGRNTSGGGAPGVLVLGAKNGVNYLLWVDSTGKLRIGTVAPTEGTVADTTGTVVGTQT